MKKLGLYYSNNNIPKIIDYTLGNLGICSDLVDIKTCVWQHIENNPFPELLAMTKSRNHLNIIVQILQLLYSVPKDQYKYVLFLEHDVLYPKYYFEFPDFDDGCLVNTNYIGLSKDGFQGVIHKDNPLHQTIMLYKDSITHFEDLITKAIRHKSVYLEPYIMVNHWFSRQPCVHINHNKHFTTHYRMYDTNFYEDHSYWGNYKLIYNNF